MKFFRRKTDFVSIKKAHKATFYDSYLYLKKRILEIAQTRKRDRDREIDRNKESVCE